MSRRRIALSWSSGKDAAWTLHRLREDGGDEVAALLTTFNREADRVGMHAVRRSLVEAQAAAAGIPLVAVELPHPCPNAVYEERLLGAVAALRDDDGVTHVAFGDLFLEDVRSYRTRMLDGSGVDPLFPLWGTPTAELASEMMEAGVRARLTCVDPSQLDPSFVGRGWDRELLAELPDGVDPCGERGEFHTFCTAGPCFEEALDVRTGEVVRRDGFVFVDLLAAPGTRRRQTSDAATPPGPGSP